MKKQKILVRVISFVLMGVLLCTPINYVQASTGSSTYVSSNDSSVSDSGSGSGSTTNGWTYLNDDGYKMTT